MPFKVSVGERAKPEFRKHINDGLSTRIFGNTTYKYPDPAHFNDLMTRENVQAIFAHELLLDPMQQMSQNNIVDDIMKSCKKMFVMAVYVDMSFTCFRAMLRAGIRDDKLPLPPDYDITIPEYVKDFERFRKFQDGSCVLGVPSSLQYGTFTTVVPDGKPMPIQFSAEELNHGAAGSVHEAQIDMRFHNFPDLTADPHDPQLSQLLAIKVISKPGFASRERNFLQALSDHNISHPHILKSYAGFEYRDATYFLSEKADTDLLRFITGNANAAVAGVDEVWLRDHYRGLAGALAAIHGPANKLTAYHHDIKPSNILLFKHSNTLKLSDWGCSAMKLDDSQQASPNTDKKAMLPYLPPESVDRAPTSRPHDVWSLGCVFLEVLVWFLDGEEARQLLKKQIKGEKQNTKGCWFLMDGLQTITAESIDAKIAETKDRDGGRWRVVVEAIDTMLQIDPAERITAKELLEELLEELSM